ncbi:MAG TPA: monovalent cation:proton antiporter-2 (CPA2) family protein [Gallionella sp.]|nr:monovalent cation:proton antiporter-2 (CPA2) family protein [Gallionella sp.]
MQLLEQVAIFLLAAVLIVPIFQRAKLGAVLGYLASGMIIGPCGLGLIGDVESTLSFSEFGVVLLLFLIGLELEPRRLWTLRNSVFGLGGAQVAATGLAIGSLALASGFDWQAALIIGFGCAMSSTALVMTSLAERGQLLTRYGRESFAILLFQDLAVIPMLALLPLLSDGAGPGGSHWVGAAKGVAVIIIFIAGSRLVIRPALKFIARNRSREVFTAAALLLVIGTALTMQQIGLSMSLGAFLAGVLLADSEFRHELEADIEPFKGLLLGLFFMAVGMSANLTLMWTAPLTLFGLAFAMMLIKFTVMYVISRATGSDNNSAQRLAVALAQGGEFAFVLFAAATGLGVFGLETSQMLIMAVTVSLLLAPLLMSAHESLMARWLERTAAPEYDAIDGPANPVIIAGFGRVGQIVSRVLRMCGIAFTAIEVNYQQVDFVRRFGSKIYFGDATRLDLLMSAKIGEAKLFVLAIDDIEASLKAAALVRQHFPDLPILARARNRAHFFQLRDLGIQMIYRETFLSSIAIAQQALLNLGFSAAVAGRAVTLFRKHDEELIEIQHAVHHDEAQLIQNSQLATEQLRSLFEADSINLLSQDSVASKTEP